MKYKKLAIAVCLGCGIASGSVQAQTRLTWVDFGAFAKSKQDVPLRPIVLSERPGDVLLNAIDVKDGAAQISGRLSAKNGSGWATLGIEFGRAPDLATTNMTTYGTMRIRLAAQQPGIVRIRLKGTDLKLQRSGCYPVMMQWGGTAPTDYVIPLAAFEAERYCGTEGVTLETTLPDLAAVEVTANDPSDDPVRFAVGRIEFLRTSTAEPLRATQLPRSADWKMAWAEEFDTGTNKTFDGTRWAVQRISPQGGEGQSASAKELGYDGQGRLTMRLSETSSALRLLSKPAGVMLFGRLEARFKAPSTTGMGARLTLQGAPLTDLSWPDAGEIVLAELSGGAPRMTVGLIGPQLTDGSELSSLPLDESFNKKYHTIALEWEPGRIRWLLDDILVKEVQRTQLPIAAQKTFDQWPYLFQMGVDAVNSGEAVLTDASKALEGSSLLVDYVHMYKRADLVTAASDRLATWMSQNGGSGTVDKPRPVAKAAAKPVVVARQQAAYALPARQVVCNRENKLGLMLCH